SSPRSLGSIFPRSAFLVCSVRCVCFWILLGCFSLRLISSNSARTVPCFLGCVCGVARKWSRAFFSPAVRPRRCGAAGISVVGRRSSFIAACMCTCECVSLTRDDAVDRRRRQRRRRRFAGVVVVIDGGRPRSGDCRRDLCRRRGGYGTDSLGRQRRLEAAHQRRPSVAERHARALGRGYQVDPHVRQLATGGHPLADQEVLRMQR
ncbi:unnamed protein product, partial [Ixodes pacificus]